MDFPYQHQTPLWSILKLGLSTKQPNSVINILTSPPPFSRYVNDSKWPEIVAVLSIGQVTKNQECAYIPPKNTAIDC